MRMLRQPVTWGVAALGLLTVVALTAALLYLNPPGQKAVVFYTTDAASIRPGDDVRIAGVTVGKVQDLSLENDRVLVRTRIKNSAFVGNESQVQVRMLTVVGGYYVNLVPLGAAPLGNRPIPVERVIMPYSLIRTLNDSTKITQDINAKPINESLNDLQAGLVGSNLDTLTTLINSGNALTAAVDRQRGQVTQILNLTDEYVKELSNFRETLAEMVRKIAIIQESLVLYSKGVAQALNGLGQAVDRLMPIFTFYANHRDDFLEKVRDWQHKARLWIDRNGLTVRILKRVQARIQRVLDAQNAPPELLATDLCIPTPGSPC